MMTVYPAALIVSMVVPGFLVLTGIVGNVLTINVLSRTTRSEGVNSGSRNYLVLLSISDLLAVIVSLGRFWVVAMARQDILLQMSFLCQLLPCLDFSLSMIPAWILVAMALQVHQGLMMPVNSGNNITKWKARVFAGSAFFLSIFLNCHSLMFFIAPDKNGTSGGETVSTANVTEHEHSPSPNDTRVCVPQPGAYAHFYFDAWPYISVSASVCVPLLTLFVLWVWILRLLSVRSRPSTHVPLLASFRTLVTSVLFLSLSTVLVSGPLCGLSYVDAWKYWTGYPETLLDKESWQDGQFTLWVIFRLMFYLQFSGRWVVTCCCCQLWRKIRVCRRSDS